MYDAFWTAIHNDWTRLGRRPSARHALASWAENPLLKADSLDTLRLAINDADKATADRMLAALAARAATDTVAVAVILHALRPGLHHLICRITARQGHNGEIPWDLFAIAWERTRTYPIDRRPTKIAANILLDTNKRYRQAQDAISGPPDVDVLSLDNEPFANGMTRQLLQRTEQLASAEAASAARLRSTVDGAIARSAISPSSARLLWALRVEGVDSGDLAAHLRVTPSAVERRSRRIVADLRLAAAS